HPRKRALALRKVEIGRDVMLRPTLVDDALQRVAVTLLRADDLRVEGRLRRQVAQGGEEVAAQLLLAAADAVGSLEGGDGLAAGVEVLLRLRLEEPIERVVGFRRARLRGQDGGQAEEDDEGTHGGNSGVAGAPEPTPE